ncbi:MAG: hypothetical protein PGN13_10415 [Patulibacter minatonensis]
MTRHPNEADAPSSRDPLAMHLDALADGLADATARSERRRRRGFLGAGVGAMAIAAGLGALVILPGAAKLDPVAEARAALEGADESGVLHYVVATEQLGLEDFPGSAGSRTIPPMEVWTATSGGEAWRMRFPADGRPARCEVEQYGTVRGRPIGPELVTPIERAQDETTSTAYSPFSRTVVTVPRPHVDGRHRPSPLTVTPVFGRADARDPVAMVRAALRDGDLHDAGPTVIEGRQVRKLVGRIDEASEAERRQREADQTRDAADEKAGRLLDVAEQTKQASWAIKARPTTLTYFVDARSYAPVQLRVVRYAVWVDARGKDHWRAIESRDHYSVYERLPDTPPNAQLLTIRPPAGTRVVHETQTPANTGIRPAAKGADEAADARCRAARRP